MAGSNQGIFKALPADMVNPMTLLGTEDQNYKHAKQHDRPIDVRTQTQADHVQEKWCNQVPVPQGQRSCNFVTWLQFLVIVTQYFM